MWWLYYLINFLIFVLLGTLACVPALLLLFKSGLVGDSVCWRVYNTPTKANISANLAESSLTHGQVGRKENGTLAKRGYPWIVPTI